LDEAFRLSVGFGAIGSGAEMTELEFQTGGLELVGDVAGPVIRHDRLDGDAAALEPTDGTPEEAGGAGGSLIGKDLRVRHSSGVVDGDMDEFPADTSCLDRMVSVDTMTDAADPTQLLDVHVDQFTRPIFLVSEDGLFGLEAAQAREAVPSQDAGHSGRAQPDTNRDLKPGLSSSAQAQHFLYPRGMGLPRYSMRSRATIDQGRLAGPFESFLPLERCPARYASLRGGPGHRHPFLDPTDQQGSTRRAASGIVVKLHLGSSDELVALDTSSLTDLGPDGQETSPVNNVLRNDT
jgi:hypothetical protein